MHVIQNGSSAAAETKKEAYPELDFLGVEEVAAALGVSAPTARDVMHRADFPLILAGRRMLVEKSALLNWAAERRD